MKHQEFDKILAEYYKICTDIIKSIQHIDTFKGSVKLQYEHLAPFSIKKTREVYITQEEINNAVFQGEIRVATQALRIVNPETNQPITYHFGAGFYDNDEVYNIQLRMIEKYKQYLLFQISEDFDYFLKELIKILPLDKVEDIFNTYPQLKHNSKISYSIILRPNESFDEAKSLKKPKTKFVNLWYEKCLLSKLRHSIVHKNATEIEKCIEDAAKSTGEPNKAIEYYNFFIDRELIITDKVLNILVIKPLQTSDLQKKLSYMCSYAYQIVETIKNNH
jgi:hypothetical protein